jgi:hypothetical protein
VSLARLLRTLEYGELFAFRDWPNADVPHTAGTYTVWRGARLIYVGVSARSVAEDQGVGLRESVARGNGLFAQLNSHASGRRSGDQFCVYVADRLVLPTLSAEQIASIGAGRLSFDELVRRYIHEHLGYRFVEVADGATARAAEAEVRRGALRAGKPLLNALHASLGASRSEAEIRGAGVRSPPGGRRA